MKKQLITGIKIVFSSLLIGYLFIYQIDIREVLSAFSKVNPGWLIAGASLHITGLLFSSVRWQFLLKAQDIHQPIKKLFSYYLVGHFFNMFLPTKVGGDIIRIYDTSRDHGSTAQPMAVVLIERISGMLTMILLAALVLMLQLDIGIDLHSKIPGLHIALVLYLFGLFILPFMFTKPAEQFLFKKIFTLPVLNKLSSPIEKIYKAFQVYGGKLRYLFSALAIGVLLQINYFFHYYFIARALGIEIPWLFFFVIIPIRTVVLMAPFFVNGIGLREFFDVGAFNLIGISQFSAVAFAELAWGLQILFALFGGLVYVVRHRSKKESIRQNKDSSSSTRKLK